MSGGSANGGLAQSGHSTVDVQLRGQLVSHQFRQRKVETAKQSDKGLELVFLPWLYVEKRQTTFCLASSVYIYSYIY